MADMIYPGEKKLLPTEFGFQKSCCSKLKSKQSYLILKILLKNFPPKRNWLKQVKIKFWQLGRDWDSTAGLEIYLLQRKLSKIIIGIDFPINFNKSSNCQELVNQLLGQ